MKLNTKTNTPPIFTHEGGKAVKITPYNQLRRSVLSCLLWEDTFYEDGISVYQRIADLVPKVAPELVGALAINARTKYKLRHVPLALVCEMVKYDTHKPFVADTLAAVIQRPDELAETLALYWAKGRTPIANSIKRGLARAFTKFNEYSLAKYNQDKDIKLKDVLFLSHAKPLDEDQANLWKRLINNELKTPDTWEVELSASKDKKASWERLLAENKLGALALLRNLRNFKDNGVNEELIVRALERANVEMVLPYRFIAAAKFYPGLENQLENLMFKCLESKPKLNGKTVLLIDVSGSMDHKLSINSEMSRLEAANGLAMLAREMCQNVQVFTFSRELKEIPNRRGFALKDSINQSQAHRDTFLGKALTQLNGSVKYDRLICLTDEQSADNVPNPTSELAYIINVATNKNGIGYRNNWTHLDGFSEVVLDFIYENESL